MVETMKQIDPATLNPRQRGCSNRPKAASINGSLMFFLNADPSSNGSPIEMLSSARCGYTGSGLSTTTLGISALMPRLSHDDHDGLVAADGSVNHGL